MTQTFERPLTLPEVAEVAQVQYRTLHTWLKRGLLTPSFQASTGSGKPNLFSSRDAVLARVLADLRKTGMELDLLETVAERLRDHGGELGPDAVLSLNGSVSVLESSHSLHDALDQESAAFIYRLSDAAEAIEAGLVRA
jgi:DNA-binding transcriptional MerR regulator